MRLSKTEKDIEAEPMAVRVALHPFLAGMEQAQLRLLAACALSVTFSPGEIVLREGESRTVSI